MLRNDWLAICIQYSVYYSLCLTGDLVTQTSSLPPLTSQISRQEIFLSIVYTFLRFFSVWWCKDRQKVAQKGSSETQISSVLGAYSH
jgi:hypothetical protein